MFTLQLAPVQQQIATSPMASTKENAQRPTVPAPAPVFPPPPTFPPLPPLPPSDACASRQPMEAAQHHYLQSFPPHLGQTGSGEDLDTEKQTTSFFRGADDFEPQAFPTLSLTTPPPPKPTELGPKKSSTQLERTIWSITPEELSVLATEMAATRQETAEPSRKLSYAEASKRNLPGFDAHLAEKNEKAVKVEEPPVRTFKKYYGLPIIPLSRLPHDFAPLEGKEVPAKAYTREASSEVLDYSQNFGLSANTPTFYPRQTTDTTELLQMLKTSLAPKKIAPHMDWWPGDWKCTNCGNHVQFLEWDSCVCCSTDLVHARVSELLVQGHMQALPSWATGRGRIRLPAIFDRLLYLSFADGDKYIDATAV